MNSNMPFRAEFERFKMILSFSHSQKHSSKLNSSKFLKKFKEFWNYIFAQNNFGCFDRSSPQNTVDSMKDVVKRLLKHNFIHASVCPENFMRLFFQDTEQTIRNWDQYKEDSRSVPLSPTTRLKIMVLVLRYKGQNDSQTHFRVHVANVANCRRRAVKKRVKRLLFE